MEAVFLHAAGGNRAARLWVGTTSCGPSPRGTGSPAGKRTLMSLWSVRRTKFLFPATRQLTTCLAIPIMWVAKRVWNASVAVCLPVPADVQVRDYEGVAPPGVKLLNHATVRLSSDRIKRCQNHPDDVEPEPAAARLPGGSREGAFRLLGYRIIGSAGNVQPANASTGQQKCQ